MGNELEVMCNIVILHSDCRKKKKEKITEKFKKFNNSHIKYIHFKHNLSEFPYLINMNT